MNGSREQSNLKERTSGWRRDGGLANGRGMVYSLLMAAMLLSVIPRAGAAATVTARAAAERQRVYVGEPFLFQIQVSGSEAPRAPDLSGLAGFAVENLGGQRNSSESVSVINGRVQRRVFRGYIINYRLTAKRVGNLVIPAFDVAADGQVARTQALTIQARSPSETDTIKLRATLSRGVAYVGEPVTLTLTWYLGQNVRNFQFTVPVLSRDDLFVADPKIVQVPGKEYLRIPLSGGEAIGEKGVARLGNREYTTIQFSKILIPRTAGTIPMEPALVACEVATGYQQPRSRSGFQDFFNTDFFGRSRNVYSKVVAPSNPLSLEVRTLPQAGRPPGFTGHVGRYQVTATARPTEVNVGDPITLTVTLGGPDYLGHVELPALANQASLVRDFKIPSEMAEGKNDGDRKVFTQTIRALRPDVAEVPPIELPYFDTEERAYKVARSDAIPLEVRVARVVTAADAEGLDPAGPTGAAVESWTRGIAYNYEGADVLVDQRYGPRVWLSSPLWRLILFFPPLVFGALLTATVVSRRRNANPARIRSRRALAEFKRRVDHARSAPVDQIHPLILEAVWQYLGDKLEMSSGALTFKDAHQPLRDRGVDESLLEPLGALVRRCEAGRYAGNVEAGDPGALADRSRVLIGQVEEVLK